MRLSVSQDSTNSTEFQDNLTSMIKGLPEERQARVLRRIGAYPPKVMLRYIGFYYTLTTTEKSEFLRSIVEENGNFSEHLGEKFGEYITKEGVKNVVSMQKDFSRDMRLRRILVWMPEGVGKILGNFFGKK